MRVLLISPKNTSQLTVASGLRWNMTCVQNLSEALEYIRHTDFQAILVVVGPSPEVGQATIAGIARARCKSPIVACLQTWNASARIQAMELGALTCIEFPMSELEADMLVRAIVRQNNTVYSKSIEIKGVSLDLTADQFSANGELIPLTRLEHQLLELLFLSEGKLVSRDKIMNHLYGTDEEPEHKIIDVFICKIRRRLRRAVGSINIVETVWGGGYRVSNSATELNLSITDHMGAA